MNNNSVQKVYTLNISRTYTFKMNVIASSLDKAKAIARHRSEDLSPASMSASQIRTELIDCKDFSENIDKLFEMAVERIIQEQKTPKSYGDAISFKPVPIQVFQSDYVNGSEFSVVKYVDAAYLNGPNTIMIQFVYGSEEEDIDWCDLYVEEKINVLKAILE